MNKDIKEDGSNDGTQEKPSSPPEPRQHQHKQPPPSDEDVLYNTRYDVVLCGTGLVQSIVASALARYSSNTMKILHVDSVDHYGNLDAVYTYPYLLSKYNNKTSQANQSSPPPPTKPPKTVPTNQTLMSGDNRNSIKNDDDDSGMMIPLHPNGDLQTLRFHTAQRTKHHCTLKLHRQVQTPYGMGTIDSLLQATSERCGMYTLVIELTDWMSLSTANSSTRPKLYIGGIPSAMVHYDTNNEWYIDDDQHIWHMYHVRTISSSRASQILDAYSRSLALDITPYLIYAAGPAVEGLLASTVSNYIEFKSVDALLYYTPPPTTTTTSESSSVVGTFTRVPCSKKDVFASKLLSPLDKRRLMKFLHLALDYAGSATIVTSTHTSSEEEEEETATNVQIDHDNKNDIVKQDETAVANELQSWNERYLNQGRSLIRPQNKVVATNELQHLQTLCSTSGRNQINGQPQQKSFLSYLQTDQQLSSSSSLVALIRYALALDTNSNVNDDHIGGSNPTSSSATTSKGTATTTVRQGMEQLCAHMIALGRFGTTAFLVPLYGSGELSQAFCRSAAVYGTTYLLRRTPTAIVVQRNSDTGRDKNQTWKVNGIQLSKPDSENEGNDNEELSPNESSITASKRISCQHIVVPEGSVQYPNTNRKTSVLVKRVLRRISIVTGKPIQLDKKTTPHTQQQQQRHVLIIPPHSVSLKQTSAIHGVVIDETVNVTPQIPGGCTIVHLTTSIDHDHNIEDVDDSILSDAMSIVLQSFQQNSNDETVVEIFHASFSYEVPTQIIDDEHQQQNGLQLRNCDGLHMIRRPSSSLTADIVFTEALTIFLKICPTATKDDFLNLSQATTEAIQATLGPNIHNNTDEEDDETTALNSALGMIEQPRR